ncbi:hypothetical protein ACFX2J_030783 [Malus domestica]
MATFLKYNPPPSALCRNSYCFSVYLPAGNFSSKVPFQLLWPPKTFLFALTFSFGYFEVKFLISSVVFTLISALKRIWGS